MTMRRVGSGGSLIVVAGTVPRGQSPKAFCTAAAAVSTLTSPTMAISVLFGWYHCLWNAIRSSRVNAATDSGVPLPGLP
jgi:hypothetical protein